MRRLWCALMLVAVCAGCPVVDPSDPLGTTKGSADRWRVLSEAIFYDAGGNDLINPVTTYMDLYESGRWEFGSSSGTLSVAAIETSDWTGWGINEYAPTRKVVLNGWNGGTASGPIEETEAGVDFFWVIYRTSTGFGPATVQIKFGAG